MKDQDFDLVIQAGKSSNHYWKDLWKYRELFYFLAWRDILVRYKEMILGIAWSILRPIMVMLAFVFVFNKIANLTSSEAPYPILVLSGLLPWQLFSNSLAESSNSLISNSNLLSKIYFPRIIIPTSSISVCMIDFIISLFILFFVMAFYDYAPTYKIIFLPVFLMMTVLLSIGFGLLLAALNVKYRDIRYVIPFIVQFGLYISPVGFSAKIVSEKWQMIYALNPMVGIIEAFRWSLLQSDTPLNIQSLGISSVYIVVFLFISIKYFRATERSFVDRI